MNELETCGVMTFLLHILMDKLNGSLVYLRRKLGKELSHDFFFFFLIIDHTERHCGSLGGVGQEVGQERDHHPEDWKSPFALRYRFAHGFRPISGHSRPLLPYHTLSPY